MTALALFNIQRTGQEYAIFNNLNAARSWPFMPSWVPLPPPMSIDGKLCHSKNHCSDNTLITPFAGPTFRKTVNMLHIPHDETINVLLGRIRDDQDELNQHVHAPLFRILEGLGDEAPFLTNAILRQSFNWDFSLRYRNKNNVDDLTIMKRMGRCDWPDG